MYHKGENTFSIKWLGLVSICSGICLFISFIALFGPILAGSITRTDLQIVPFNTPADVPDNLIKDPSKISQFFGRQVQRRNPQLDLELFKNQFYRIDIYNATECANNITSNQIFICSTDDYVEVLRADCQQQSIPEDSEEYRSFGFNQKIELYPKISEKLEGQTMLSFPKTQEINCRIVYNVGVEDSSAADWREPGSILVNVLQRYQV